MESLFGFLATAAGQETDRRAFAWREADRQKAISRR